MLKHVSKADIDAFEQSVQDKNLNLCSPLIIECVADALQHVYCFKSKHPKASKDQLIGDFCTTIRRNLMCQLHNWSNRGPLKDWLDDLLKLLCNPKNWYDVGVFKNSVIRHNFWSNLRLPTFVDGYSLSLERMLKMAELTAMTRLGIEEKAWQITKSMNDVQTSMTGSMYALLECARKVNRESVEVVQSLDRVANILTNEE